MGKPARADTARLQRVAEHGLCAVVANLDALPATGGYVIALPMKIATASGALLRMIGLVPDRP